MVSAVGRFAQADTIIPGAGNPQAWDRYAYALNNPVKYNDPSGHGPCDDVDEYGNCIKYDDDYYINYYKQTIKEKYNWDFEGNDWTHDELSTILKAGEDIEHYVDGLCGGKGLDWMKKYFGEATFVNGGLSGGYSFVTGFTIHLSSGWVSMGTKHIVHELSHVWDNSSAKEMGKPNEALWLGGGNADLLYYDLTGNIPFGLRWMNRNGGFMPDILKYGEGNYGNHSTADYFAESFKHLIYDPGAIPHNSWGLGADLILNAYIVAEVSLIP